MCIQLKGFLFYFGRLSYYKTYSNPFNSSKRFVFILFVFILKCSQLNKLLYILVKKNSSKYSGKKLKTICSILKIIFKRKLCLEKYFTYFKMFFKVFISILLCRLIL